MASWNELESKYRVGGGSQPAKADAWGELENRHSQQGDPLRIEVAGVGSQAAPEQSFWQNLAGGAKIGLDQIWQRVKQSGSDAMQNNYYAADMNFGGIADGSSPDYQEFKTQNEADIKASRNAPVMKTAGGKVGNIGVKSIPAVAASFLPGGQTLTGSALISAAAGGMEPVLDGESSAINMGIGGIGGVAGYGFGQGVSKLAGSIAEKAAANPRVAQLELLKREGVTPTIGQTKGGRWNSLEEKLTSVPILGDAISMGRNRALNEFNNAAINRATAPIGARVEGAGFQGVRNAGDALSDAFNDGIRRAGTVQLDDVFANSANKLRDAAQILPADYSKRFNKLLGDAGEYTVDKTGKIAAGDLQAVDSMLSKEISRAGKDSSMFSQDYAELLTSFQGSLRDALERGSPADASRLIKSAREGWANLVRVEGAAKAGKNASGVFTPAQLNQAIQSADSSVRGRAVGRGTALMQDLGDAGQSILGNKVPNSFTTDRLLYGTGALGTYMINPAIPAGLLGGSTLYLKPVTKGLNALLGPSANGSATLNLMANPLMQRLYPAAGATGLLAGTR